MTYDRSALLAQLKIDEGMKLFPYRDPVGALTIGIGHNLDANGIDIATAEALCDSDVARAEMSLDAKIPWWRNMTDARQQGLVNLCFNMGWGDGTRGLSGFRKMLSDLQSGDYDAAANDLLLSKYAAEVGDRAKRIAQQFREG